MTTTLEQVSSTVVYLRKPVELKERKMTHVQELWQPSDSIYVRYKNYINQMTSE